MLTSSKKSLRHLCFPVALMLLITLFGSSACKRNKHSEILLDSSKRYYADFHNLCSTMDITNSLWGETDDMIPRNLTFIDFDATPSEIFLLCSDSDLTFVVVLHSSGLIREIFPVALPKNADPAYIFSSMDGFVYIFYETRGSGPWDIELVGVTLLPASGEGTPIDLSSLGTSAICDISFNGTDTFAFLTEDTLFLTNSAGQIMEKTTVPKHGAYYQSVSFVDKTRIQTLYTDSNLNLFLQTLSIFPTKTVRQDKLSGFVGAEVYSAQLIASRQPGIDRVFLETENAIYGYNEQNKLFSKYLDKDRHDFIPLTSFLHDEGDQVLIFGITNFSIFDLSDAAFVRQNYGLFVVSFSEDDRPTITIRVGLCAQSPEVVHHYIRLFAKTHPEYVFEFIDYNAPQTNDRAATVDPIDAMYADLLSDHPPDILFIDPSAYEQIASPDALTDMNPLMAQDKSFDGSAFLENIWAAGEIDGARYFISPFFGLHGMYAQKHIAEQANDQTLEAFGDYIQARGDKPQIFRNNTPQEIAEVLISFHMQEILLPATEEQGLDVDRLRSIISFSHRFGTPDKMVSLSLQEQFSQEKILFEEKRLRSYLAFLYDMEHDFGSNIDYISAPGLSGNEPLIFSNLFISIPLASENPEVAWALVRFILSPKIQDQYKDVDFTLGCMPIRTSSFESMLAHDYEEYRRGMGPSFSELHMSENHFDSFDPFDPNTLPGIPVPSDPLPKEETMDAFCAIVSSAHSYMFQDRRVSRIIFEELAPVFAGQKNAEEAVAVIEKRLQNYFDEGN